MGGVPAATTENRLFQSLLLRAAPGHPGGSAPRDRVSGDPFRGRLGPFCPAVRAPQKSGRRWQGTLSADLRTST